MLKNRLPLFITNETTTLLTKDNFRELGYRESDIGKYLYEFPRRFIEGRVYPKKIEIDHIGMYCHSHSIQFGSSAYADFNTESEQLPYCLGFVSVNFKTIQYKYTSNRHKSLIWFKSTHEVELPENDPDLSQLIQSSHNPDKFHHPDRFVISGSLYF